MKKILFISKYLSTRENGFESRLALLIRLFKKKKFIVSAITSTNSLSKIKFHNIYNYKKIDNVNYFFINENKSFNFYSFQRIFSWIKFEYYLYRFNYKLINFKPDIIYVSSLSLFTILNGVYLKKKFNAKLVFEMRDFWPFFLYRTGKFSRYNPIILILDLIEKFGIYKSDLIISLIPRINEYLKYRGFKNKKNFKSTFPLNKKYFKIKKNSIYLDNKKFNISYAGNFGFDNYLDELLNLISKSKKTIFNFHFFGNGSQKRRLIHKYSNFKNINFYDAVKYEDLHSVLSRMDCLILSFGFNNKYPMFGYELNKLNNYLMAAKPVIVIGSKKNLLKSRGNFIFVEQNDNNLFEKKLFLIKNNYFRYLKIAKLNKLKFLKRNNANNIFRKTLYHLNNL